MYTTFDRIVAAFNIANSHGSIETIIKETTKQLVKNQHFPPFHETNLISLIDAAIVRNKWFKI